MIRRIAGSLFNVSGDSFKHNLEYKATTLVNLMKKGLLGLGYSTGWTGWRFSDCIVKVRFNGLSYRFVCKKGKSYHIYLNPYFHEYDIGEFVCRSLQDGDTFIDVGAMGGLYTIMASKLVGTQKAR